MLKTFEINLDIEKELYTPSNLLFAISTNDLETVELIFTITQDGAAFDLTGNTVELAIKKPSGLTVYQESEITEAAAGEARVKLSLQSYNEYGIYIAEVYVRNLDQLAVTSRFYYSSTEAIMNDETLESTNDWSAFLEVLFSYDKKPLIVEGVPVAFPEYIGQMAVDTVGQRAFISYDLSDRGWQLIASAEGGGGLVYWTDILAKPLTFAPAAHTHDEYLTPAEADLLYLPIGTEIGGGAPADHTHEIADVVGLQAELDSKLEILPTHTHVLNEVEGLQIALDGKADNADLTGYAPANHVHAWDTITGKPNTFAPAAHNHPITEITGLTAALAGKADDADLAGKANVTHTHTTANITDFAAGVAANIPAEYLTATEGAAAFQAKGTYLTAVPAEYLTATEGDAAYQPKGTYLTAVPAEYLTQTEGDARYAIKGTEGGTVAAAWGDIAGTLANQADLQAALNEKAEETHTHPAAEITDFAAAVAGAIPAGYLTDTEGDARYMAAGAAPAAHTHTIGEVTGLQAELDSKLESLPTHSHLINEVTGLQAELDSKLEAMPAHTHTAAQITDFAAGVAANIPAEYLTAAEGDAAYAAKGAAPAAHTHAWADITGEPTTLAGYGITDGASDQDLLDHANWQNSEIARLETDIAAKADTGHTHTTANITDFAAGVAANIPAEYLTATEGDAVYAKTANVYSKGAVDTALAGKAPTAHTHTTANITDFAAGVAANIPAEYLTATEGDAAYAAKGAAPAAHTHTTAQITDFAAGVAANIPAAYMTDTETAAAYQPKGTYLTAVPVMTGAQIGGALVGNGLQQVSNYLGVKAGAGLGIAADNSLQVQTTNTTPAPVKFWTGTAAAYTAIATKDANTLYFVTG